MPDRRRQIQLLISTRFDLLWFPAGHLRTQSGLAPSKRIPCPDCGTSSHPGWQIDAFKRRTPCTTCGGRTSSSDRPKAGKGVVAVDPMDSTRQIVGSTDTHASARPRKRVKCDRCQTIDGTPNGVLPNGERCPSCDGTGWRDLHAFDLQLDVREEGAVDALTAAIDRRDQAGSYHELDLALAGISRHVNKPLRYEALTVNATQAKRLLDEVYLTHGRRLDQLTAFEQALVELALDYLDTRMPDPIRVPAGVAANDRLRREQLKQVRGRGADPGALKARDQLIRRWAREGRPYGWIEQQTGLSDRQVREIVNGAKERVA